MENAKRTQTLTTEQTINGIAKITGVAPELVRETLQKAAPEDIEKATSALGALALFMSAGGEDLVDADTNADLKSSVLIKALIGDRGPDVDLSELAGETSAHRLAA